MLSSRLKKLRQSKNLSQEDLAKKINTSKGTISNYENKHSTPSNDMLKILADVLDTTTDYLLGRIDEPYRGNETNNFDPMAEINHLLTKYNIDQSGFFDIEKWKAMGPDEIRELESYFEFITSRAKEKKKEDN